MEFQLSVGDWATQQVGARAVRSEVFLIEQSIPVDLEWDEMDALSLHAVAHDAQGNAIGTGRLLPDGHIGRMAVCKGVRGAGIGSAILRALMQHADARGDKTVVLHAQVQAEPFYVRHGFVREDEIFLEAGIEHIVMRHRFA